MQIEKLKIKELIPAEYNPRKDLQPGDAEYEQLKRSIEQFGYVEPIIWNKTTTRVVGGHQRLKVLLDLGYSEVECVIIEMDEEREKALNVALNKIRGDWDKDKLVLIIEELQGADFDVSLTGFEPEEISELMGLDEEVAEDNFDIDGELEKPTVSKEGDLWLLGRHRLLCGDCTKEEAYKILMDGKKANLVVTDPPYNIDIQGGTKDKLKIKNDKMGDQEFYEFLLQFYKCTYNVMADGAAIYVFHADTEGINFRTSFRDAGFHLSAICVWVKNSLVLSRADFHFRHEPIIYGWKPTGKHKWYSDRKQTTVWEYDRPKRSEKHPTTKPIPLVAHPIKNSSTANGIVLDPFVGSGSTLIACEQMERICYAIDLDEKYVDVAVKRYIEHVGSDDEVYLIRDGKTLSYSDVADD